MSNTCGKCRHYRELFDAKGMTGRGHCVIDLPPLPYWVNIANFVVYTSDVVNCPVFSAKKSTAQDTPHD